MLCVETIGKIRRRRLVQGESISAIARDLGLSRNTVQRALRFEGEAYEYRRAHQPMPKLGPFVATLVSVSPQLARSNCSIVRLSSWTTCRAWTTMSSGDRDGRHTCNSGSRLLSWVLSHSCSSASDLRNSNQHGRRLPKPGFRTWQSIRCCEMD